MHETLTAAVHQMLLDKGQARELAGRLGKAYSTLMRQLNPHDDTTFFNADHVLAAMEVCASDAPLAWLASRRGYLLVPMPADRLQASHLQNDLARMSKEVADVVLEFSNALADGRVTRQESCRLRKEVREACAALMMLAARVDELAAADAEKRGE
jgi:hypothetical protein